MLYEAAPMAYITRQAEGYSSDGMQDVLMVRPSTLAGTTPLYLGSPAIVREVESMVAEASGSASAPGREGVPASPPPTTRPPGLGP